MSLSNHHRTLWVSSLLSLSPQALAASCEASGTCPSLVFDASVADTDGLWSDVTGPRADVGFPTAGATRMSIASTYPNRTHAWQFPGAVALRPISLAAAEPTLGAAGARVALWLHHPDPNTLSDHVLFEAGGAEQGLALTLSGGVVSAWLADEVVLSAPLQTADLSDLVQIVVVYDEAPQEVRLYIDGLRVDAAPHTRERWADWGDVTLGGAGGDVAGAFVGHAPWTGAFASVEIVGIPSTDREVLLGFLEARCGEGWMPGDACDALGLCVGDLTSGDTDFDLYCDADDLCLGDNTTGDVDGDGICEADDLCFGDDAAGDADLDGLCEDVDLCFGTDFTGDPDADGLCDDVDDDDVDGVVNLFDTCPGLATLDVTDTDGDGFGDACDPDDDDDGTVDGRDPCPLDAADTCPVSCAALGLIDVDGDDVCDWYDRCPAMPDQPYGCPTLELAWVASMDLTDDGVWQEQTWIHDDVDWTFSGTPVGGGTTGLVPVTSRYGAITHAYRFEPDVLGTVSRGSLGTLPAELVSGPVTLETWFRAADRPGVKEIVWESGARTSGVSFAVNDNHAEVWMIGAAGLSADLTGRQDDFVQVTAVHDPVAGILEMYLDGRFVGRTATQGLAWTGDNASQLGGTNSPADVGGNSAGRLDGYGRFTGEIASLRIFSEARNATQVVDAFSRMGCPGGFDIDQDGICNQDDSCVSDPVPDPDGDGVCSGDVCVGDDATGDLDGDGLCDDLDTDADGDGVVDAVDSCIWPADDPDGDGVCGAVDPCPWLSADVCDARVVSWDAALLPGISTEWPDRVGAYSGAFWRFGSAPPWVQPVPIRSTSGAVGLPRERVFTGAVGAYGNSASTYGTLSTGSMSVEIWFQVEDPTSVGRELLWETGGNQTGLALYLDGDVVRTAHADGGVAQASLAGQLSADALSRPVQVVYTLDLAADTQALFVNGDLLDTAVDTAGSWSGTDLASLARPSSSIGAGVGSLGGFRGGISRFTIYDRPLDAGEIATMEVTLRCDGADLDGDANCDDADPDRDGDGLANADDACPDDASGDLDNDGICRADDLCPGRDDSAGCGGMFAWNASYVDDGDAVWEELTGGDPSQDWTLVGATREPVSSGRRGITHAWTFDGTGGGTFAGGSLGPLVGDPALDPVSIELWFRPATTTPGQEILLESGGAVYGFSLALDNALLLLKTTSGTVSTVLTTAQLSDFTQAVLLLDPVTNTADLFVDGVFIGSRALGGEWTGTDAAGLGRVGGTAAGGDLQGWGPFTGQVAALYVDTRLRGGSELSEAFARTTCGQQDVDGDLLCDDVELCIGDNATGDSDGDGVCDDRDACLGDDATGDVDGDGTCGSGDLCTGDDATGDADGDGVCDDVDACTGDDASGDGDGDGICDELDPCEGDNASGDADSDGVCDDLDLCFGSLVYGDDDNDGLCDGLDPCFGDESTGDDDNDRVCNDRDPCFGDEDQGDLDGDGICDDLDVCVGLDVSGDADGDGTCDDVDLCFGDELTGDGDADGVCDDLDPCPLSATDDADADGVCDDVDLCDGPAGDADLDADGLCDSVDEDDDGDGVLDAVDVCPRHPLDDLDGDGTCDDADSCPRGLSCDGVSLSWDASWDQADGSRLDELRGIYANVDWLLDPSVSWVPTVGAAPSMPWALQFAGGAPAIMTPTGTRFSAVVSGPTSLELWLTPSASRELVLDAGGAGVGLSVVASDAQIEVYAVGAEPLVAAWPGGELVQVVVAWDSDHDELRLVLDGTTAGAVRLATDDWADDGPWGLGGAVGPVGGDVLGRVGAVAPFTGRLASFQVYQRALDDAALANTRARVACQTDDLDADGLCDADDADDDGDGLVDVDDPCPTDPGNDPDGDGLCARDDVCPDVAGSCPSRRYLWNPTTQPAGVTNLFDVITDGDEATWLLEPDQLVWTSAPTAVRRAVRFDGTQVATLSEGSFANLPWVPGSGPTTLELWFQPYDPVGTRQQILWESGGTTLGAVLALDGNTLEARDSGGVTVQHTLTATQLGQVTQAAVQRDEVSLCLFVDGVEVDCAFSTASSWSGTDDAGLGGTVGTVGGTGTYGGFDDYEPFVGTVHRVALDDVALGATLLRARWAAVWCEGALPDTDGDGLCDTLDACVGDDRVGDLDGDGTCDDLDDDDDGDGLADATDPCPNAAEPSDLDGDGVCNDVDACPLRAEGTCDDMVAHWSTVYDADGDDAWRDARGVHGNLAWLFGQAVNVVPLSWDAPILTHGLSFAGTRGATLARGDIQGIDLDGSGTLEMWFQVDDPDDIGKQLLFETGREVTGMSVVLNGTSLTVRASVETGFLDPDIVQVSTTLSAAALAQPIQLAVVLDLQASRFRLYVNGAKVRDVSSRSLDAFGGRESAGLGRTVLTAGASYDSGGLFTGITTFRGQVAALTLDRVARTDAQIAASFRSVRCGLVEVDGDGDGVCDQLDQCLGDDAVGDFDADGTCDDLDPCPLDPDDDADGDGLCADVDPCLGDNASGDTDGDAVCDDLDPCPADNPDDPDGDGVCASDDVCLGDDAVGDRDFDGVCDDLDACLGDDTAGDLDGDGTCDDLDGDDDGDGIDDLVDLCPLDASPGDVDFDGVCNSDDVCPGYDDTACPPFLGLWNASFDTVDDSRLDELTGTGADWLLGAGQAIVPVTSSRPGITRALRITGQAGAALSTGGFGDRNQAATIELWFRVPDPADTTRRLLFEAGGSVVGTSIGLDAGALVVQTGGTPVEVTLDPTTLGDFVQVVAVIDLDGGLLSVYVDGAPSGSTALLTDRWSGTDAAGLGGQQGSAIGGDSGGRLAGAQPFFGDIAVLEIVQGARTASEIATSSTRFDLCGPADADEDGVCDAADPCPLDPFDDGDGDGVCDSVDLCLGDDATGDSDGDGVCDDLDLCLGDDANGDADGDGLCTAGLEVSAVVARRPIKLRMSGAPPGTEAWFFVSTTPPGPSTCHPQFDVCLDLGPNFVLGIATVDATGHAEVQRVAPPQLTPGTKLYFQAWWLDGDLGWGESSDVVKVQASAP